MHRRGPFTLSLRLSSEFARTRRAAIDQFERRLEQRHLGEVAGETDLEGDDLIIYLEVNAASSDLVKGDTIPRLQELAQELGLEGLRVDWPEQASEVQKDEPED